jgi:hypothetical protein
MQIIDEWKARTPASAKAQEAARKKYEASIGT